jgi:FtsZ-binding cell division protein ZapB
MNTYDIINELYAGVDDEELFKYDENILNVYDDENSDEFEVSSLIKYTYDDIEYYFTPNFQKVKFCNEKKRYYKIQTDMPYTVKFTFPNKNIKEISLPPKLNLEYDQIHDLIIRLALDVAIKYIQCNYINFCYDEIDELKKKFKKMIQVVEQSQIEITNLREENQMLKKMLIKLERKSNSTGLEKFINNKQTII